MHTGSCLCGSVTYTVDGDLNDFGYCHCTSCRKASGTAYGANSGINRESVSYQDPNQQIKKYESSPGKFRVFCGNCGSPLYAYLATTPHLIRIRLGSLDTPFNKTVKAHTFVSDKASWETIEDTVPQFETWADKSVLVQVGSKQE